MRPAVIVIILCFLQISCSTQTPQSLETNDDETREHISTPTRTGDDAFEVVAWVDNENPEPGERVMLYGSLLKYGIHLGGMAMRAVWPDETQERGMPNCSVQVIYGSGVCIIDTTGFKTNVYVPINVSFEYQGTIYRGQTGFTPK